MEGRGPGGREGEPAWVPSRVRPISGYILTPEILNLDFYLMHGMHNVEESDPKHFGVLLPWYPPWRLLVTKKGGKGEGQVGCRDGGPKEGGPILRDFGTRWWVHGKGPQSKI